MGHKPCVSVQQRPGPQGHPDAPHANERQPKRKCEPGVRSCEPQTDAEHTVNKRKVLWSADM
jgi:hypothetical protein